ncbi:hypothetical protein SCHPADRAFT_233995 [Schizopora paradoxa]|uniref:Uncharacterized protein n=1 Tax=Schizopora paradoxa TaxID=27342 RepID=A0A0H2RVK9_9AGAM|nr:hypothetical protein SCHPADRAFT_233995 [Schizopora paradoxa]
MTGSTSTLILERALSSKGSGHWSHKVLLKGVRFTASAVEISGSCALSLQRKDGAYESLVIAPICARELLLYRNVDYLAFIRKCYMPTRSSYETNNCAPRSFNALLWGYPVRLFTLILAIRKARSILVKLWHMETLAYFAFRSQVFANPRPLESRNHRVF